MSENFKLGDKVLVAGSFNGVVDEIRQCRGMTEPLYSVEWWDNGDIKSRCFLAEDLRINSNP